MRLYEHSAVIIVRGWRSARGTKRRRLCGFRLRHVEVSRVPKEDEGNGRRTIANRHGHIKSFLFAQDFSSENIRKMIGKAPKFG
jgi:hypothetical protein